MLKATKQELNSKYLPALIELSKMESLSGKIAYNCARSLKACETALKDIDKSRTMILESRAVKNEDGSCKLEPMMREEEGKEGEAPKMVPVLMPNGKPQQKYSYETPEKEEEAKIAVMELESQMVDVDVYPIPASEIKELKSMKNGGLVIFNLGEIIDDSK